MTAIAIAQLPVGFVFAADGRMRMDDKARATASTKALALETDAAQKIFELVDRDKAIAYAITGVIANDDFSFNLVEETIKQAKFLSGRSFADFSGFSGKLCANINRKIIAANHFPKIREKVPGVWTTAFIVFAGYFMSKPVFTAVEFHHQDAVSRFTQSQQSRFVLAGSGKIMQAMFDANGVPIANSRFSKYAHYLGSGATLNDAERFVTGYISACCSPLAYEIAPEECKIIGGHIHVAEITPIGRFRWRIPPLQKQS